VSKKGRHDGRGRAVSRARCLLPRAIGQRPGYGGSPSGPRFGSFTTASKRLGEKARGSAAFPPKTNNVNSWLYHAKRGERGSVRYPAMGTFWPRSPRPICTRLEGGPLPSRYPLFAANPPAPLYVAFKDICTGMGGIFLGFSGPPATILWPVGRTNGRDRGRKCSVL